MDRSKHLASCKQRALEYLDRGDLINAVASMGSDLDENPETKPAAGLVALGMMYAANGDSAGVRRWIEGFHALVD